MKKEVKQPTKKELFSADCKMCENSLVKKDNSLCCELKHIDCSIREGKLPCTHYLPAKREKNSPKKLYWVTLKAVCVVEVEAQDENEAAEIAEWDDMNFEVEDCVRVEEAK